MDWELLDHEGCATATNQLGPPLQSSPLITTDYFSINPPTPLTSHSSSSSSTHVDSYLSNHLFPFLHSPHQHQQSSSSPASSSNNLPLSHDSDSDSDSVSDSVPATVLPQTPTEDLLSDAQAAVAAGGGALDSQVKEEEEEKNKEKKEAERRSVWWWKVPLEVFKYWVVRVSPVSVWSLSVAAASFLGLVILGRRLYKMKRKTQTLKLNVALDDKKLSQLMGRVARLNEAFSVVRRVPIVRPSLPAQPSVTLRPVVVSIR